MKNETRNPMADNRKYIRESLLMWDVPPIDIANPEAVR